MKKRAFTIIELLVSVMLISIVILAIIKIQSQTRDMAHYITNRALSQLTNTLFIDDGIEKYHRSNKDAYTVMGNLFKNYKFNSREILEKYKRDIFINDDIKLEEEQVIPFKVYQIRLKGDSSSASFYRFGIE
ncbi:hypothetical protein MNB_SV-15-420 [hydrothermal vent metagenome]|uniref:Prepilin-type N-terminal cleavage/methylation domain-containing protein n=1 Tax=hydrothermal vent metagenome TaxID=652676 RepID=A0A1W1EIS3_9ZZZZ